MKKTVIALISVLTLAVALPTEQFLDMVSLRCLDKTIGKKSMKESELKSTATAVAEEILQTLEFLEPYHLYQVAVVLGDQNTNGYCKTELNRTGKIAPEKDIVHYKYYPMGAFAAYTFIYAGFKKNATNCTSNCSLISAKVKDIAAKIAEKETFGKVDLKKSVTQRMMNMTLQESDMKMNGNYSYAFEYLILNSKGPLDFATANNFKEKNSGIVSILAKGSINTVFACIFGYQYS